MTESVQQRRSSDAAEKRRLTILVIDELMRAGSVLAAELREQGYATLEASSVESACAFVKTLGPNVKSLDIVLLALKPSTSEALQYETACDQIAATLLATGRSCPAFMFFSLTETSAALAKVAMDAAVVWFVRRDMPGLTSELQKQSEEPPLPKVIGFHNASGIEDICVDVDGDTISKQLRCLPARNALGAQATSLPRCRSGGSTTMLCAE